MELAIDTSTRYASAALSREGEIAMELAWRSEQNHSVDLVPVLRQLMDQAGTEIGDIEAIFVARGPGGFSALRVGISVAKALAMAQAVPLVAVGTLDVEARPYMGIGFPVCAVIGAGRDLVYAATYDAGADVSKGPGPDYRVESHSAVVSSAREGTIFCGEAALTVAEEARHTSGAVPRVAGTQPPTRRPGALAEIGYLRLVASDVDDPDALQPIYMRGSQFEAARRVVRAS